MRPDAKALEGLVRRIVEAVHPLKIILFGSGARGDMSAGSDVDVMVVMPEGANHTEVGLLLHTRFGGLAFGVDVLVATSDEIERHRDDIGFVYYDVVREGEEIYAAAA
jgi:predicted nucleotidyltransferase